MLIGAQAEAGARWGSHENNAEEGRPGEMKAKLSSSIQGTVQPSGFLEGCQQPYLVSKIF